MNIDHMRNLQKKVFEDELENILAYWVNHAVDSEYGGFYGQIHNDNSINKKAIKGAVLNSRILWTFSAAYNRFQRSEYMAMAWRSFLYIETFFVDTAFGGLYWSVDFTGKPLNKKKQVYALAFGLYGMSEFYKATKHENALTIAKMLFNCIEQHGYDPIRGGYFEAFSQEWDDLSDMRLSDKDVNEKKTMNTHLHILEAYTNLYHVWPSDALRKQILHLLKVFEDHIINQSSYHLNLFFDENWNSKSEVISFGHDIEASWLLLEAAGALGDSALIAKFKEIGLKIVNSAIKGLDENGGLNYELDRGILNNEKHWWVQAEAMVGLINAFQISGEYSFHDYFERCWNFTERNIIDHQNGEWFWGINKDQTVMQNEDKVGLWKCPYHNARACLEISDRLSC